MTSNAGESRFEVGIGTVDAAPPADAAASVRDHAVHLPGGRWRVWRSAVVRGAGFPARLVLPLAPEEAAAAADRYLIAVDEVERCRSAALGALACRAAAADPALSQRIRRLRWKLCRDSVPADATGEAENALRAAFASRQAAHADLVHAVDTAAVHIEERLRELTSDARFVEALLWQDWLSATLVRRRVRDRIGSPGQRRKAENFVALHAQRYAVKNDSIGFFGPIGWASIVEERIGIEVRPGPGLVAHREVFFEGWCIDELVARLNQLPGIRRWTSPRLRTGAWRDGDALYLPGRGKLSLSPLETRILNWCDGERTAVEIARALQDAGESADGVWQALEHLAARNVVTWRLEVPSQLYPERELEARLNRIGEPVLRAQALAPLYALIGARARVAAAAGKPEELELRLRELESEFTLVTGRPGRRNPGRTYAARRLVYEDCRRDCEIRLGRELLRRLGPPLSIVLDSARWAAGELAAVVRHEVRRWHAELRAGASDTVEGYEFINHLRDGGGRLDAIADRLKPRYQDAWRSLLQLDGRDLRGRYDAAALAGRAREIFAAKSPGWSRAGYLSPDIMVAADGIEALRRGEFHAVLGELHGTNTLLSSATVSQHPDPQVVLTALARDAQDEVTVVPQLPKEQWLARLNRMIPATFWRYECFDEVPSVPRGRSLPAAMLVAVDDGDTVRLRARDGSVEFEALDIFGYPLVLALNKIIAQPFLPAAYLPRVTIGDLTISRETWHVGLADMKFLEERDASVQFAAIRRWARDRGMPRQVFYKSPIERKPWYLDFDSTVYVRLFVKQMKGVPPHDQVRIAEMLPSLNGTWLHDAAGERYTCEFRLAARCDP